VAAHLEPEILIIDEVLAVGDAAFQRKCLGKIGDVVRSGRTVLLVSHNMATIQNLCTRAVFLANGRAERIRACAGVLRAYLQPTAAGPEGRDALAAHRKPGLMPVIQDVRIFDGEGEETDHVYAGSPMTIEIHYDSPVVLEHPVFGVFAESMVG